MKKDAMKRREAMASLAKMMAAAAGIGGGLKAGAWGAGLQVTPNLSKQVAAKLETIKANLEGAKIIKCLLFPRLDVYINEFGRGPTGPGGLGMYGCEAFFPLEGNCGRQDCGQMGACGENTCTEQNCGKNSGSCGTNNCGKQSRLSTATPASCQTNNQIFSNQFLDSIKSDPFIQAFLREMNIPTTQALSQELQRLLLARR